MNINTATLGFFDRSTRDIAALRAQAESLQGKVASGERLTRGSDDPVAAAQLRALARADSGAQVDKTNAGRAATDLSLADTALSSVADAVTRARELATQAANGTLSTDQLASIGTEVAAIHAQLVELANTKDAAGHALFGGNAAGDAYTIDASGSAVYAGVGSSGELEIAEGQTVGRGVTGVQAFGGLFATVKMLADALQVGGAGAATAARNSLSALDTGLTSVTTAQAVVGARLTWIDHANDRAATIGELRATQKADVGGSDIATTVAALQQTMLTLEASQAGFSRLSSLSLFSLLR